MGAFLGTARGFGRALSIRQRLSRLIAGRVDGTGTASIVEGGNEMSLTDNGVGDYTLTFTVPFQRVPVVNAMAIGAAAMCTIGTISASAVQILVWDAAGVAADADFHVQIVGFDSANQV